ncbi:hypothetical protein [Sphingobacterium sp. LRF_L2]|uniref:hypothetical protein n=1 Tax=Sphingobacterium sp. LRF_L2 TaxID=3369421 RepID=UPI003F5F0793
MLTKLVHYLVLLCYVNILAYEGGADYYLADNSYLLNGESILEFVLDDVLDIPIDEEAESIELRYDEYRAMPYQYYLMPLFVLAVAFLFHLTVVEQRKKHPVYDAKKRQIIPGYYTFLYRLKPF